MAKSRLTQEQCIELLGGHCWEWEQEHRRFNLNSNRLTPPVNGDTRRCRHCSKTEVYRVHEARGWE